MVRYLHVGREGGGALVQQETEEHLAVRLDAEVAILGQVVTIGTLCRLVESADQGAHEVIVRGVLLEVLQSHLQGEHGRQEHSHQTLLLGSIHRL